VRFFATFSLPFSLNIGSDKNLSKDPQYKSIITIYLPFKFILEHYAHTAIFATPFSKLILGFHFWTF